MVSQRSSWQLKLALPHEAHVYAREAFRQTQALHFAPEVGVVLLPSYCVRQAHQLRPPSLARIVSRSPASRAALAPSAGNRVIAPKVALYLSETETSQHRPAVNGKCRCSRGALQALRRLLENERCAAKALEKRSPEEICSLAAEFACLKRIVHPNIFQPITSTCSDYMGLLVLPLCKEGCHAWI